MRRVAAPQVLWPGPGDSQHGWIEADLADHPVVHHPDQREAGRGQLVEPVLAVEHQRGAATAGQHAGQDRPHPGVGHAHGLCGWPGRVGHRPEEVENGRDAKLAPGRGGMAERRVIKRGKQERDPGLRHQPLGLGGRQVDRNSERLEHVRSPARRGRRPVPVLDHPGPGGSRDDSAHRGDVDRARSVAAGTDQIDQAAGDADRRGVLEHRLGEAADLRDGLALHPQGDPEARDLGGRGRAVHDLVHRPGRLVRREGLPLDQRADQGWPRCA